MDSALNCISKAAPVPSVKLVRISTSEHDWIILLVFAGKRAPCFEGKHNILVNYA